MKSPKTITIVRQTREACYKHLEQEGADVQIIGEEQDGGVFRLTVCYIPPTESVLMYYLLALLCVVILVVINAF